MRRCIELARLGQGNVSPNPMVGCVIVRDNKIIGEGYHEFFGGPHAEVNAIRQVKDLELLKSCTLYVSLEPCAHHGKTPPCADLIIHHQIPEVVVGSLDPFHLVAGKGIKKIQDSGAQVISGVLKKECDELNKRFFTFHKKQRPFVILKWAESKDGFIDKLRSEDEKGINWITGTHAKKLVHQWRSQEDAILVGRKTVVNDNPSLTVREVSGRNPTRIVLDSQCVLDLQYEVFNEDARTIVINAIKQTNQVGQPEYLLVVDLHKNLNELLHRLYQRNIQSVIIEGGAETLNAFIQENLWDEARVFRGDVMFERGVKAPILSIEPNHEEFIGADRLRIYSNL